MEKLIKFLNAERGRRLKLATSLSISASAITQWEANGIPAERVVQVEAFTGIPREELRPDIFAPLKQEPAQ